MPRGCPDCEVTILYEEFKEELIEELQALAVRRKLAPEGREYKWRWSQQKMISDVAFITSLNAGLDGKGYNPEWTIPVKRMVMVLREELTSFQRAEDEAEKARIKAEQNR